MTDNPPILELRGVKTWFPIRRGLLSKTSGYIRAVDGVDLTIRQGEIVGLVGESGCGKTTLGRTILGLEQASEGEIRFSGRRVTELRQESSKALCRSMQMVFQDPMSSLNPRMTIFSIVTEGMIEHDLLNGSAEEAAVALLQDVGLDAEALYRYPHEFSGGQRQRISIARALSVQPSFVVCDEAVSALDVSIQAQVINLLMDLRDKYELSYLFISHDLSVVHHIADRIAVMYDGKIIEEQTAKALIGAPQHEYTKALIDAVPIPGV